MNLLVRAASLSNYAEVARQFDLDPERLLRQAGLDRACLHDPDLRINANAVLNLLELSAAKARCPSFGLLMAESRRLSNFGAVSLLLRHEATLRAALEAIVRHRAELNDALAVHIEDNGRRVLLREELRTAQRRAAPQAVELALGVMVRLLRAVLGYRWTPAAVHFRHAAPAELSVHRRVFGIEPTFARACDGIEFPSSDLDRPNPGADPAMLRYAQQLLDAQAAADESLASEVRDSLRHLLPGDRVSIRRVARNLGYAPRTLQRRLDALGESYSHLLSEVRRERAEHYLAGRRHSLSEVARLLGFAELSVFSRWYRSQFGHPPRLRDPAASARALRTDA